MTLLCAGLAAMIASPLMAANIDTFWDVENGDWFGESNWTNGLPGDFSPADASRALFNVTANSPAVSDVTLGEAALFDYLGVGFGKTVNLQMGDGSSLRGESILVGRFVSGSVLPSHLNVSGPATGSATIGWTNFLQIGGAPTGSGDTVTFSGPNLFVEDTGLNVTVGRQGNGHTLTIEDGAQYSGKAAIISGTQNTTSGVGNNHKLVVTGEGSQMTLSGVTGPTGTLGLIVGSRPLTGSGAGNVQSGNTVEVLNGGKLSVIGDNEDATVTVTVGANTYRTNNSIQVSGAGSVLELTGDLETTIGFANTTSYNNRLVVSDGGTVRTEGKVTIQNGNTIAANRRNILDIGPNGTFITSNAIENNGGLVRLNNTGALKGETMLGAPQPVTLSINQTGRFEASGSGLGSTVTVQVGDGTNEAVLAIGTAGVTTVSTLVVNSLVAMNDNSTLEVDIFGANQIDSIELGENGVFDLGSNVNLTISLSGYTLEAGDSYQLFTGEVGNVLGSFGIIDQPTLADGLSWDMSNFNAAGNWTFQVVPEPSTVGLLLGGLFVVGMGVARARRKSA